MQRGLGSTHGYDDVYTPRMRSSWSETQVCCFPSAELAGRRRVCALRAESVRESVKTKKKQLTPSLVFHLANQICSYFIENSNAFVG